MPSLLRRQRRGLQCHFCNQRTSQSQHLRTFQCEHCEAVNHLDENGEITDPPTPRSSMTIQPQLQYAHPPQASQSSTSSTSSFASIFCPTCIKNQSIVSRLLAEYIPDESSPDYTSAVRSLPAYEARLNQDYPQCCPACEPAARLRMAVATRAAAADNLRRVVQKSRMKSRDTNGLNWRRLVLQCARAGWFASIAVQLLWHYFIAQGPSSNIEYRSPIQCVAEWPAPTLCRDTTTRWLPASFLLAVLCSWWNPGWQRKLSQPEGRLSGLGKYYTLHFLLLIFRLATVILLNEFNLLAKHNRQYRTILHGVCLILLSAATIYTLTLVKLNTAPAVDWKYTPPRLTSAGQFIPPPAAQPQASFPLQGLAPAAQNLQPWRPPTPPIEGDDDAMDWTPSQHSFQPIRKQPKQVLPSPFYGTLPTLSGGMRRTAAGGGVEPKKSIGLPPGFFDRNQTLPPTAGTAARSDIAAQMAEPRFFPTNVDTGLEKMFGTVFSLGDEDGDNSHVAGARVGAQRQQTTRAEVGSVVQQDPSITPHAATSSSTTLPLFQTLLASVLIGLWFISYSSNNLNVAFPYLKPSILALSALSPLTTLLHFGFSSASSPVAVVELASTVILLALTTRSRSNSVLDEETTHLAGLGLLGWAVVRGVWSLIVRPAGSGASSRQDVHVPVEKERIRPHSQQQPFPEFPQNVHWQPSASSPTRSEASIASSSMASTTAADRSWDTPQRVTRSRDPNVSLNGGFGGGYGDPAVQQGLAGMSSLGLGLGSASSGGSARNRRAVGGGGGAGSIFGRGGF